MAAKDESGDVLHRDVEFSGQEMTEAGAIQHASHAANLLGRQARILLKCPDHRIERVGDADDEGVGRVVLDALANGFHDLQVDAQKVIAAHPRFAGHTGSDDADISARDIGVIRGAFQRGVEAFGRAGFGNVERFALWRALGDVEENDVAEFFQGCEVGKGAPDLTCADQRDFRSGHVDGSPIRLKSLVRSRCLRRVWGRCKGREPAYHPLRRNKGALKGWRH